MSKALLKNFIGLVSEAKADLDLADSMSIFELKKTNKAAYEAYVDMLLENCSTEFIVGADGKLTAVDDASSWTFEESVGWVNEDDEVNIDTGFNRGEEILDEDLVSLYEMNTFLQTLDEDISAGDLQDALGEEFGEREFGEDAQEELYNAFPGQMEQIENGNVLA